jgi:hypothetical protein
MKKLFLIAALFLLPCAAHAQSTSAIVVASCGTPPAGYTAGQNRQITQDTTGKLCDTGGGGGGSTTANQGAPNAGGASAWPVATSPSARTIIALDVATVTTGGAAVTALTAGHRTAGGFLQNPAGATVALCINEQGTASGTTSAGATTCIPPGGSYTLAPAAGAVSVVTSDSSHPFSGEGLN